MGGVFFVFVLLKEAMVVCGPHFLEKTFWELTQNINGCVYGADGFLCVGG